MGGNQHDEIGPNDCVSRRPEEAADHGNIHDIWNAATGLGSIVGDDPAYRESVSVLDYSRRLRLANIKTWKCTCCS
jgi:hypothetical protein